MHYLTSGASPSFLSFKKPPLGAPGAWRDSKGGDIIPGTQRGGWAQGLGMDLGSLPGSEQSAGMAGPWVTHCLSFLQCKICRHALKLTWPCSQEQSIKETFPHVICCRNCAFMTACPCWIALSKVTVLQAWDLPRLIFKRCCRHLGHLSGNCWGWRVYLQCFMIWDTPQEPPCNCSAGTWTCGDAGTTHTEAVLISKRSWLQNKHAGNRSQKMQPTGIPHPVSFKHLQTLPLCASVCPSVKWGSTLH